ncbi:MAG: EscR/YscR/HrcR family type III secretion system export apparatus protein [Polyangiales bacterium]
MHSGGRWSWLCLAAAHWVPARAAASSAAPADVATAWPSWAVLVAFALVPVMLMVTTSYLKISVVLSLLRNALGVTAVPSGVVVAALSALLTFYVMAPVATQVQARVVATLAEDGPAQAPRLNLPQLASLWRAAEPPWRRFLQRNAGKRERTLFHTLAKERTQGGVSTLRIAADSWWVLLPAFIITELKEAFQIAFLLFVPFVIIDLVVMNVIMVLGMQGLAPSTFSIPIKLLLFVVVDGWWLVTQALVLGYR